MRNLASRKAQAKSRAQTLLSLQAFVAFAAGTCAENGGSADYGAHIRHRVDQPHRHDAVISGFGHDKFSSVVLALILLGANAG
jgi:hypothetical protein